MPDITVTLTPAGAITNGAEWCIEGKTGWQGSGTTYSATAGTYIVQYRYAEGYSTPAEESVTMVATPLSVTGAYGVVSWKSGWQPPISMCFFKGQVFTCGVKHTTPDSGVSDARLVRWSEIGAFRFLDCTANPLRNEAGEYYLGKSDSEMALRVLPLENAVIVYGSFSTIALKPVTDPAPTYSPQLVIPTGIKQPLAVGGSREGHLMVDRSGYLRLISQGKSGVESKNLGYQDIFAPMQSDLAMATGFGVISIAYNHDDEEFYISDGRKSYLYSEGALTELGQAYTSYVNISGTLLSTHENSLLTTSALSAITNLDSTHLMYFATEAFNLNISGIKQLQSVELSGSFRDAEVSIEWRNNRNEPFRLTPWVRCSPTGICKPVVSGVDFRVHCRMPYQNAQVDGMTIEWQLSDKNNVRGNYASSNAS
jgi:hypothetical protein